MLFSVQTLEIVFLVKASWSRLTAAVATRLVFKTFEKLETRTFGHKDLGD